MLSLRLLTAAFMFAVSSAVAASTLINVSIRTLLAHPEQFHGKVVSVVGYYACEFEAGCELRFTRAEQPWKQTIQLEFPPDQLREFNKAPATHGWLRVVGRFEYSRPTPERLLQSSRHYDVVEVWQGFNFHAYRITVSQFERI